MSTVTKSKLFVVIRPYPTTVASRVSNKCVEIRKGKERTEVGEGQSRKGRGGGVGDHKPVDTRTGSSWAPICSRLSHLHAASVLPADLYLFRLSPSFLTFTYLSTTSSPSLDGPRPTFATWWYRNLETSWLCHWHMGTKNRIIIKGTWDSHFMLIHVRGSQNWAIDYAESLIAGEPAELLNS